MTTPYDASRNEYTADGTNKTFAYTFRIQDTTHIAVYADNLLQTLDTDYDVTNINNDSGGQIVFVVAPANGVTVTILRNEPISQESVYIPNEAFPSKRVEDDLDKLTEICQELRELIARAPKFAAWSLFHDLVIDDPIGGYLLRWKPDVTGIDQVAGTLGFGFVNPITSKGDLIQGGTSGVPERLGIGATDGMLSVVSGKAAWKTLAQTLAALKINPSRQVIMFRTADSGNDPSAHPGTWVVYGPDGAQVSTVGSTSQGLQEAINYAAGNGFDLLVLGGMVTPAGVDPSIIATTDTIVFPVMQKCTIRFQDITLNVGGTPQYGMQFNSVMSGDFEWRGGQIVCDTSVDIGVLFQPRNELPLDPNGPVIGASRFLFPSVVMTKSDAVCIRFDVTYADIADCFFEFIEPNGGAYGVQVFGYDSFLFEGNHVKIINCHPHTSFGLSVGTTTTNADHIRGNHWDFQGNPGDGGGGVDIYGTDDYYRVAVTAEEGTVLVGVKCETSASRNVIVAAQLNATTPILDLSTDGNNTFVLPREGVRAHKNGTDQTGVATATWTDVTFATKIQDLQSSFNGTTFTARYPGLFQIAARVSWATMGDQIAMGIQIVRNGTENIDSYTFASGTGANQGAQISIPISLAQGDTIKIQGWQATGGPIDIQGASELTWLSIQRT